MSDTTHLETRRLNADYPKGTVILYQGDTGFRSGLVLRAERGELVVQTPATAARRRPSRWGQDVSTPETVRVSRHQVRGISEKHSRVKP